MSKKNDFIRKISFVAVQTKKKKKPNKIWQFLSNLIGFLFFRLHIDKSFNSLLKVRLETPYEMRDVGGLADDI